MKGKDRKDKVLTLLVEDPIHWNPGAGCCNKESCTLCHPQFQPKDGGK